MNLKTELHTNIIGMIRTVIKEGTKSINASWVTTYYVNAGKTESTAKHYTGAVCLSLGMKRKNKPTLHYVFDANVVLTNINAIIGVDNSVWMNSKTPHQSITPSPHQVDLTTERAKKLLMNNVETEIFALDNQMTLLSQKREVLIKKMEILKDC